MMEACCSRFTPAEGGARLAALASTKNTLATEYSSFIATRLVHEEAYKIRGCLFEGSQRSVYVTRATRIQYVAYELRILTDLAVIEGTKYEDVYDWSAELNKKEVLVCTSPVLKRILEEEILTMANINVLILDSCHLICKDENLQYIMKLYKESDGNSKPRILALTYPLFASNKNKETQEQTTEEIINNKDDSDNSISESNSKIVEENNDRESNLKTEQEVSNTDNQILENNKNKNDLEVNSKEEIESIDIVEEFTKKDEENELSKGIIDDIKKQNMNIGVYENLDDFNMYEKLEWKIENLEKDLCCQMDLAEDIDGGKRMSSSVTKPKELIIEYTSRADESELPQSYIELETFMRETVNGALAFIDDHRHDPSEIYGEELCEEFKNIPDPTIDPRNLFQQFLYVLEQLGPYAADKAAVSLLTKLEKLKIKVPYERHFLLLCLCTTIFVKIRCYADLVFSQYESDWEKIRVFCTPKLLRFAEILEKFRPAETGTDTDGRKPERSDSNGKKVENDGISEKVNSVMNECQIDSENVDVLRNVNSKDDSIDADSSFKADNSKKVDNKHEQRSVEADGNIAANRTENYNNLQDISKKADSNLKVSNNNASTDENLTNIEIPVLDINIKQNSHEDTSMVATEGSVENVIVGNNIRRSISDVKISDSICTDLDNLDGNVSAITKNDGEYLKDDHKDISDSKEENNHNKSGVALLNEEIINNKQNIPNKSLTYRMIKDIDNCDFTALGDKIEDRVNTYEANLRDFDDFDSNIPVTGEKSSKPTTNISNSSTEQAITSSNESTNVSQLSISLDISTSVSNIPISPNDVLTSTTNTPTVSKDVSTNAISTSNNAQLNLTKPSNLPTDQLELRPRRLGARTRGRGRGQRMAGRGQQGQLCPDALCGLVFTKEPLVAKILFMLIVDMSRCNPKLSFLCAQYCTVEQTTERSELKECQRQNKMQEDVLKKFRMHECNLLLATPALEEGIDLPRCNLVLRWDLPPSYRSYGLCRSRARAPRATAALLCSGHPPVTDMLLENVATYKELDQIISRKCCCGIQDEPPQTEEDEADPFTAIIKPYTPNESFNTNPLNKNNVKSMQYEFQDDLKQLDIKENVVQTNKETKIDNCTNNDKIDKISAVCENEYEMYSISAGNEFNMKNCCTISERQSNIDNVINKDVSLIEGVHNCESNINEVNKSDSVPSKDILLEEQISSGAINKSVSENESLSSQFNTNEICNQANSTEKSSNQIDEKNYIQDKYSMQLASGKGHLENNKLTIFCDKSDDNEIINESNSENDAKKDISHYNNNKLEEEIETDVTPISNHDTASKESANEPIFNDHSSSKSGQEDTNVPMDSVKDHLENDKLIISSDKSEDYAITSKSNSKNDAKKDISNYKNNKLEEKIEDNITSICDHDKVIKESAEESIFIELTSESRKVDTNVSVDSVKTDSKSIGFSVKVNCDKEIDCKVKDGDLCASVDLNSSIALINRYCGKLPSDTFTRLAPQWWLEEVELPLKSTGEMRTAYVCTLRLPLNCPVKYNIVGHPMPTRVLARRMVALQACRILHKSGELDNQLMPIGKENFKAAELEGTSNYNNDSGDINDIARPGTTKRRQYYFKRTAWAFTDCQPIVDTSDSEIDPPEGGTKREKQPKIERDAKKGSKRNMLYALISTLRCALPERYNTRGRRLHAPQHANQAMGILMARDEPDSLQIPAFPVYTRSGEVRVSVEHVPDADVRLSPRRGRLIRRFMRFVFAEVLRVRRRGMKLQSEGSTHNDYYIVPTVKTFRDDGTTKIDIDWVFLELIYQHTEEKKHSEIERPILWHQDEEEADGNIQDTVREKETADKDKIMQNPLLKEGEVFLFDEQKYKEAVVTPWYRNRDQPQFFLVAEICWNLTPDSAFPSATHSSFREYYRSKYNAVLTQSTQPLLDVDHTSARLNLLTPRYVNRKGVALPVSSERTRRAKRDRLDQKQILVPELCRVHPFAAPLWFATVALPCVLYRINALLIADEIRRAVAIDVGLGIPKIDDTTMPGFQWPPLDFGWSLAEVLNADSEKNDKKREDDDPDKRDQKEKETKDKEDKDKLQKEKEDKKQEVKEKTINDILQEKELAESSFEIGTWSNDMASSIPQELEYDEFMEPLPPNLTFCTSASGGTNWCDPIEKPKSQFNPSRTFSMADSDCSYMSSDFDTDDSDLDSQVSDDETDTSGFCSSKNSNAAMGVRIEYKTAHEAEAVDLERKKVNPAPQPDESDDELDRREYDGFIRSGKAPDEFIQKFRDSVTKHKQDIIDKGLLIKHDKIIDEILPEPPKDQTKQSRVIDKEKIDQLFPFSTEHLNFEHGQVTLESIEKNKRALLDSLKLRLSMDECKRLNCFSMVDVDIDSPTYVNEKVANVGFDDKKVYMGLSRSKEFKPYYAESKGSFDFDFQPTLEGHPGPSPSVILQALTMSNANDGINLERLETIGDSFLKFAITAYLYCAHPTVHEGKLSHMRSKQVSNLNLYRLGRNKRLGARMIASKFEPHDNWLPPCHKPPPTLHPRTNESQEQGQKSSDAPQDGAGCYIPYNLITQHSIPDKSIADCVEALIGAYLLECGPRGALLFMSWLGIRVLPLHYVPISEDHPYVRNYREEKDEKPPATPSPKRPRRPSSSSSECTSTDDEEDDEQCFERQEVRSPPEEWGWEGRPVGSRRPVRGEDGKWVLPIYGELRAPPSPLLRYIEDPEGELEQMLSGYDALEKTLQYRFNDRSLLLQALTHASHQRNRLTDCYQRLEFLGDAILDYLITRHLYEDPRRHSPGALTDLRSALVNNTIFATLAARHGFHKFFRHMSPGLNEVLTKYVKIQEENGHSISEEHYLIQEDEMEQAEDVEVPKALGDLFESVAGAIFLDSGMSLGAVWKSYVNLMGAELEAFSAAAPKSPVRELLEAEPDTAKFGKPERLADGRRVRVCVEVFGRGAFKGVGRNYRIAKGTAARCALRHLKIHKAR